MKNIYVFKNYNKNFKKFFQNEKSKLKKILPKNIEIEHIGSTSVKGLGGKGIMDIIIFTPKNKIKLGEKLKKHKYQPKKSNDKNRLFFVRESKYKGKTKRFHIHLTDKKKIWNLSLKFKELLKNNKELCQEYVKFKKKIVKICKGNEKIYRKLKNKFIKDCLQLKK